MGRVPGDHMAAPFFLSVIGTRGPRLLDFFKRPREKGDDMENLIREIELQILTLEKLVLSLPDSHEADLALVRVQEAGFWASKAPAGLDEESVNEVARGSGGGRGGRDK